MVNTVGAQPETDHDEQLIAALEQLGVSTNEDELRSGIQVLAGIQKTRAQLVLGSLLQQNDKARQIFVDLVENRKIQVETQSAEVQMIYTNELRNRQASEQQKFAVVSAEREELGRLSSGLDPLDHVGRLLVTGSKRGGGYEGPGGMAA